MLLTLMHLQCNHTTCIIMYITHVINLNPLAADDVYTRHKH